MATYKVLQDIEAEDKLLGPLSLKQFGFAAITIICGYVSFLLISKGVWFMSIPFIPVAIIFAFLAFPWGRDQSTEVWLLAKIRFFFKPRKRVWDQEGIEELVTITVPKKVEDYELTKGFSQEEAKSRLKALADTIDSRGWVVKNVNVNLYAHPSNSSFAQPSQDRLLDATGLAEPQAVVDIHSSDDVLDENSQAAQQVSQLLNASTTIHREKILESMRTGDTNSQNPGSREQDLDDSMIGIASNEAAFLEKRRKKQSETSGMKRLDPLGNQRPETGDQRLKTSQQSADSVSPSGSISVNPAILALADNDDLNVATIAREANKATGSDNSNEVVVSLH